MTYDPFQTYSVLGAYSGATNPFVSPYATLSPTAGISPLGISPVGINPLSTLGISAGLPVTGGIPQFGAVSPLQHTLMQSTLQNPLLAASLQNPLIAASFLQNPLLAASVLQNPMIAASVLQNPMLASILQNPVTNPFYSPFYSPFGSHLGLHTPWGGPQVGYAGILGQTVSPFTPTTVPFGQFGQFGQFGPQLAPQSWIGTPGLMGGSQPFGAAPLLSSLGARLFQTPGINPWGVY